MIDNATKSRILDAANIVDVVSDFVTLKKAGANYKGLCPFHNDRTPSFSVSPARNYCHCFTCGKGGSPVGFIMEHEQMTYPEALRWLAKKYHIEVKEKVMTDEERQQQSERESLFIINEFAANYYHEILTTDPNGIAIGLQYFRSRGFRDDIIEKFRLGFALDNRTAMPDTAIKKGYKRKFLVKAGLCYENERNDLIDRFAGRAIFPWISMSGKVVAFGGRKLDKATKGVQQKYVNSPATDIYQKDHELYGIFQAKRSIAKEGCVYMVEGYTDVISMHQCGIENVVANSGTALSYHQIHMLHRLTDNIVLLYDGDEAGIKAAMRGTDMLLSEGMNIKVLILPDGDDPDSFSRKHSADEFRRYVDEHQTDFMQFKTDLMLKGVTDPIKRSEAVNSIVKSISVIPDPIIRATYIQECTLRLKLPEQVLIEQMNKFIRADREQKRKQMDRTTGNYQQENTAGIPPADDMPPEFLPDEAFSAPAGNDGVRIPEQMQEERLAAQRGSANAQRQRADGATGRGYVSKAGKIEEMIMTFIVRNGEKVILDNVESEDGSTMSLNVIQYISYMLSEDNIVFGNETYNRMLRESMERCTDQGFEAYKFFMQHPDISISSIVGPMIMDKHTLSGSLQYSLTKESMRQHVDHLLLELRASIIDDRIKSLNIEIAKVANDADKLKSMLHEYMEAQNLRNILAKKLGRNI